MIKINKLEIENTKRVRAVKIHPSENGLTVIGGKNGQGKTSVLDSIAWALGGNRFKPEQETREGSVVPPSLKIVMNNGLIVERKGKNSDLKVTDPTGEKAGQALLDSFVSEFAINLPKFMAQSSKEKAKTLLQIIGVGDRLYELEQAEKEIYSKRHAIGQIADQKKKFAEEQAYYPEAPKELISPSELIKEQQEILAKNGENQRKRDRLKEIVFEKHRIFDEITRLEEQKLELEKRIDERRSAYSQVVLDEEIASKDAQDLQDESTVELEANIANIDEINRKVRANLDKEKAEDDAKEYANQYATLTNKITAIRHEQTALLDNADLPLKGLAVKDGNLLYNGFVWENMSGADQLKVATAIVRKLNPNCGFVLMDKLEQMDIDTLKAFGEWLEKENLQVIATRVSTGDECAIIIEDGYVKGEEFNELPSQKTTTTTTTWKAGEF